MFHQMYMDIDQEMENIASSTLENPPTSRTAILSTDISPPSSKSSTPGAEQQPQFHNCTHIDNTSIIKNTTLKNNNNNSNIPPTNNNNNNTKSSLSLWTSSASSSSSSLSSANLSNLLDQEQPPLESCNTNCNSANNNNSNNYSNNNNTNNTAENTHLSREEDCCRSFGPNVSNLKNEQHSSTIHQKDNHSITTNVHHEEEEEEVNEFEQEQEQELAQVQQLLSRSNAEESSNPSQYSVLIPSEIILHIFKFLSTAQDLRSSILVCKLWCSCGMDLLWSRPTLLNIELTELMSHTLNLDRSETLFPYADYVRRLNFSFLTHELTDDILSRFGCCKRLERLLLPGCSKTTEEGLSHVLKVGHRLYSLDLSDIPAVTDSVLELVATHCPKLHTLYLAACSSLTDASVTHLASKCTSLKRIKLAQCNLLTDQSILALTQHCPQLMEIDVTGCTLMTNKAIQSVFRSLPQIRDVNLTQYASLTDGAFTFIPIGSPNPPSIRFDQLRVLNLTSCVLITDESLARIIPAAPRLRNLTLTKCDRITDASAYYIKLLGKHLHYLHLGHCTKLTDKAISVLTQHCTRIRYLDLACCAKLTDGAVFAMAQLQKLRRIGLVKCSNITDHGIYAMLVSQVVPQTLERVHLSYCIHLSDTAVAALVIQCPKLTHLSVTGVPAFMTPKYQKFCRIPPSEFTPHQRDVFCVFSGKGVRELRQYIQEHPHPTTTPSTIERGYHITGSSAVLPIPPPPSAAGNQSPSSAMLHHLGFTLRESGISYSTASALAAASAGVPVVQSSTTVVGPTVAGSSEEEEEEEITLESSFVLNNQFPDLDINAISALSTSGLGQNIQLQENEALELEQQMEDMEQSGSVNYTEMLRLHLYQCRQQRQQQDRLYRHLLQRAQGNQNASTSSSMSTPSGPEPTSNSEILATTGPTSLTTATTTSSSSGLSTLSPQIHHFSDQIQNTDDSLHYQVDHSETLDTRMSTPGPMNSESDEMGGISRGSVSRQDSPANYEEEEFDDDEGDIEREYELV